MNLQEQITRIKEVMGLLVEYEVLPFTQTIENDNHLEYSFKVEDIEYTVLLKRTEDKSLYELGFGVVGENSEYEVGKNLKHLNTVLHTIDSIVEAAVKKYRINKIGFAGARREDDSEHIFIDPVRLKAYFRFLLQKYPNANYDKDRFGNLVIFMNSIYPDVFSKNKDKKEIFLDLLKQLDDKNGSEDYWRWENNFQYDEYNRFIGDTDSLHNDKFGDIYIGVNEDEEFNLTIDLLDTDEGPKEYYFKKFSQMIDYIKKRFNLN